MKHNAQRKLRDEHPPAFQSYQDELVYCKRLLDEYGVPDDVWIGQGGRVSDRMTWLLRRVSQTEPGRGAA